MLPLSSDYSAYSLISMVSLVDNFLASGHISNNLSYLCIMFTGNGYCFYSFSDALQTQEQAYKEYTRGEGVALHVRML